MLSLAQLSPSLFDMLLTVIITVFYDNIEERTCAGWSGGWVLHTTQVQVTMGIKTAVMAKENRRQSLVTYQHLNKIMFCVYPFIHSTCTALKTK